MKIDLTESEKTALKGALYARYMHTNSRLEELKHDYSNGNSFGFILFLDFFEDTKRNIESIYRKFFNEEIGKESSDDRQ